MLKLRQNLARTLGSWLDDMAVIQDDNTTNIKIINGETRETQLIVGASQE